MIHSAALPTWSRASPSAEQSNLSSQEAQIIECLLHMQPPLAFASPDLCGHSVVLSEDPAIIPSQRVLPPPCSEYLGELFEGTFLNFSTFCSNMHKEVMDSASAGSPESWMSL